MPFFSGTKCSCHIVLIRVHGIVSGQSVYGSVLDGMQKKMHLNLSYGYNELLQSVNSTQDALERRNKKTDFLGDFLGHFRIFFH